jgi:hypothetical protein
MRCRTGWRCPEWSLASSSSVREASFSVVTAWLSGSCSGGGFSLCVLFFSRAAHEWMGVAPGLPWPGRNGTSLLLREHHHSSVMATNTGETGVSMVDSNSMLSIS